MNAERLAEIEKRCAAATKGPWIRDGKRDGRQNQSIASAEVVCMDRPGLTVATIHVTAWKTDGQNAVPTAEFIAHARQDIPALLDALRLADADNARLRVISEKQAETLERIYRERT